MMQHRFIEPLDVLYLRGNRLFGAAGDHGDVVMPPWPSVFAGALRSRMLADSGGTVRALRRGELPEPWNGTLGTPEHPGSFVLADVRVARLTREGAYETFYPLPADVVVTREQERLALHVLRPHPVPNGLSCSAATAMLPLLRMDKPVKPVAGYWLNAAGWHAHISGQELEAEGHLLPADTLWRVETRLGIGLDERRRTARQGHLYTSDVVAMQRDTGFLVSVEGSADCLPADGLLRLGGDGRGAAVRNVDDVPALQPDWARIEASGRFRVILTSPGIFPGGHRLPGLSADDTWRVHGATARLVSAAVPRFQVISGWDLSLRQPKKALRCAPAGSVYWFEDFNGEAEALRKVAKAGLWDLAPDNTAPVHRAEGFNRAIIANA